MTVDPITRRLALAALRLSVFAIGFSGSRAVARAPGFARLAQWVGAEDGGECDAAVARAVDDACVALVAAGEVEL